MADLTGKVAIVTGASSGIGAATALLLAKSGAKVVVAARRQTEGDTVVDKIKEAGGEAIFVKTDVSQLADNERLVAAAMDTYGRLDIAFNNAGVARFGPLHEQTEEDWAVQIGTNLSGSFYALKTQIPALLKSGGGSVVFNASAVAEVGMAGISTYAATKGGVVALARSAAVEYAPQGIRVNVVNPGPVETPAAIEMSGSADAFSEMMAPKVPMGRVGQSEEIARTVVFLASEEASYVTGQSLNIDGGYTAQ